MAVSVKMPEGAKRAFDSARAEVAIAAGRELTLQEFFTILADLAPETRERLVEKAAGVTLPLSAQQKAKVLSTGSHWGTRSSAKDTDRFLYGPEMGRRKRARRRRA